VAFIGKFTFTFSALALALTPLALLTSLAKILKHETLNLFIVFIVVAGADAD